MEFLRAIGPVFNFLLLALALIFFTRKQIRKLFQERRDRIADALGRAADAQDQARHTAEDIAEAKQAADAEAHAQLAEAKAQAEANTAAADAETAREAEAVRRGVAQTEAQLRSDMEDRVSDAAIGRITAATAGVLAQDAFAPARAALVDEFVANIGAHLTTQPSDALTLAETGTLTVEVEAAEPLSAAALDALKDTLTRAYGHVTCMTTVRPELIGGICLRIGDTHYDGTLRHALDLLEQDAANSALHTTDENPDLAACIRDRLADTHVAIDVFQTGIVTSLSDGICRVRGMADVMAGELLAFDGTLRGMVMDLGREDIGVVLLGPYGHLQEGDRVRRTGQIMSVPVGEEMIGRVVDALGRPIDGHGPIRTTERRAIESPAPGVIARKGVSVPLQTGIKAIDALVPIGRGQRELIIGDRQTGKTAIAIDAILNQKDTGVLCIYVAIGQKESTVAGVVQKLRDRGAMAYTTVVCAHASETAPMLYIAPYAGAAIGEYFMYRGRDVLIVYDDLSKQAVAYREISLLLQRPPGREAYPGDVFYLHSRLLERAARLSEAAGGRHLGLYPDERHLHHRRADLPRDGPVPRRCAPGHQRGPVRVACRRRGAARRDEAGRRPSAHGPGTVPGAGVVRAVRLGSGQGHTRHARARQPHDRAFEAAAVRAHGRGRSGRGALRRRRGIYRLDRRRGCAALCRRTTCAHPPHVSGAARPRAQRQKASARGA